MHGLLARPVPLAAAHRHEPEIIVKDALELLVGCGRCEAFGYIDAFDELIAGDLFVRACPHDGSPRETDLTFVVELPLSALGDDRPDGLP